MAKIGRSWDELDKKIKNVNKSIKDTKNEVRGLDKELKLDPTNIKLITQKYSLLEKELGDNTKKTELLKKKQQSLDAAFKNGEITLSQYQKLTDKTAEAEKKLKIRTDELTGAIANKNRVMAQARYDSIIDGATKASQAVQPLARGMKITAAATALATKYAVDYASELNKSALKYQTTVELLQKENYLIERATGITGGYEQILKSIGTVMTSVAKGSTRYNIALQKIGLSTKDLQNKTNAEVYDLLLDKLTQITDVEERAVSAQTLLGDSGLQLARRATLTTEEVLNLNEQLKENGVISSEEAQRLDDVGDRLDDIKKKFQAIIVKVVDGFTSLSPFTQGTIVFLAAVIIFLPKIITSLGAVKGAMALITSGTIAQTRATQGLTAAMTPILPLVLAISAAVIVLIGLIGILSKKARDAAEEQKKMLTEIQKGLPEIENKLETSTTTTYESSSSKRIEIEASVTADGNTPMSEENAKAIGKGFFDAIASDLDQKLGDAIKE